MTARLSVRKMFNDYFSLTLRPLLPANNKSVREWISTLWAWRCSLVLLLLIHVLPIRSSYGELLGFGRPTADKFVRKDQFYSRKKPDFLHIHVEVAV